MIYFFYLSNFGRFFILRLILPNANSLLDYELQFRQHLVKYFEMEKCESILQSISAIIFESSVLFLILQKESLFRFSFRQYTLKYELLFITASVADFAIKRYGFRAPDTCTFPAVRFLPQTIRLYFSPRCLIFLLLL